MGIAASQRGQALRRLRRARRRQPHGRERAAHRPARPQRRRQVDPAAHHRRPRGARLRHRHDRRRRRDRGAGPAPQRRLRLPALRGVQAPVGLPQRRLRPRDPPAEQGRDPQAGRRAARTRAPEPVRRPDALAAVRRAAPADGPGPRARGRAQGAAARRAVRRARREGAQGAARLAAPPARRGARHDPVRHPRPGRGPRGLRRAGRDQRRADRAGRLAERALRPPGQRLRHGLPRPGDPARRSAGPPARHRHLHRRRAGRDPGHRDPAAAHRVRGAGRARRRRQPALGAADPRAGRGTGSGRRRHGVAAALPRRIDAGCGVCGRSAGSPVSPPVSPVETGSA